MAADRRRVAATRANEGHLFQGVAMFSNRPPVITVVSIVFTLAILLSWGGLVPSETGRAPLEAEIVIEHVTLVSPERTAPLLDASVGIRGGRIVEIRAGATAGARAKRIDGRGGYLIPGLIDSHVHVGSMGPLDDAAIEAHPELLQAYRAQLPRAYLRFGFTTLVDLDVRAESLAWFAAAPVRPHLEHCGRAVRIVGGYGAQRIPRDADKAEELNLVYEPGQSAAWPATLDPAAHSVARAVDRIVAMGGVCVKTFVESGFGGAADWPVPRAETLQALRDEATRRGLVFVIHANAVESWRAALAVRADVIAHGLWHWRGDRLGTTPPSEAADVIRAAAAQSAAVQPTIQAVRGDESIFSPLILDDARLTLALPRSVVGYLESEAGRAGRRAFADEYRHAITTLFGPSAPDPASAMRTPTQRAAATLKMMANADVRLIFGTDTPSNEGIGNPPGLNGRFELQDWADAGVPPQRILRAATLDNAAAFGLSKDIGSIEVGKRADLLLLRANPLESVAAYDAIDTIFLEGVAIAPDTLLPKD